MAPERAIVGALSHAEPVELVVRQSELIDRLEATIAEQQALIGRLEARVRELEEQRDRDDPTKRMPGLKPAATARRRKAGPRKRRQAPCPRDRRRRRPREASYSPGPRSSALPDRRAGPPSPAIVFAAENGGVVAGMPPADAGPGGRTAGPLNPL